MNYLENACLLIGRFLMGVYFILPGISKITGFESTSAYMAAHDVPFVPVLLVLTIILQLGAGVALIVGFQGKWAAFVLAGLSLVISIFMHNFWDMEDSIERTHETQNFFKNMGIVAGLLVIAGLGTGRFSIDSRMS
ncbi:MAG: putative oxidoreductase [Candidatus Azotimanducaceae bacterium]|jgi:putative oxidoreductase